MNSSASKGGSPAGQSEEQRGRVSAPTSAQAHDTFFRLIEDNPFGVYLVDADFRLRVVSAGAQKVFSNVRPLLGRDFAEVLRIVWAEPFATQAIDIFRHTLATGDPFNAPSTSERRQDLDAVESYDWKVERVLLPDGQHGVVCYFYDLTQQQAVQSALEFLGQLSQKLERVTEAGEISRTAAEMTGAFFKAHRCHFYAVQPDEMNVEVLPGWNVDGRDTSGVYNLSEFGEPAMRETLRRESLVVDSVAAHPLTRAFAGNYAQLSVLSFCMAPFSIEGKWVATVVVTADMPRHWTQNEISLLENIVARVWPLVERAQAAQALRDSEKRYRALFEELNTLTAQSEQQRRLYETILGTTPDLVYVFGLDHRFLYANAALLQMWGKTWEESIGKNCLELGYAPWHAEMHDREIDTVVATKRPIRGEVPFNGTSGRRDYDYIFVPVFGANGEVEAVAGTTRDITDRKQAEEAIRLRTAQFETLLHQAPVGVYLVNSDFQISHVNPPARAVFGKIPNLIGRDFDEVLHILWPGAYADELVRIFRHTLETGEPFASPEMGEQRLDRRVTEYYEWRTDRITLPSGSYGVVCYFRDISSQVKARQRIQESEERFRTLVSVIADVPWVADPQGNFITAQLAWESFTGQTWQECRGTGWLNAFHPDDAERIQKLWQRACATSSLFECQGRMWHAPTQQWRHISARATPIQYADFTVREWVGACTDVDAQKRTEEQLRIARDAAESVSRAKDRFLAVLSHELRTPLTPVLMSLSALEHDSQLPTLVREDLAMVKRNIELETKLIDDLLDLSRITSGKLVLNVETVDLHEMVERVCEMSRLHARELGVNLEFTPFTSPIHLTADAARLQQVLWNVIRNAIKFTAPGGFTKVTTKRTAGDRCEICVEDSGIGIPAESLPHIFDAFEQGGTNITRQFGGLGLGLAISKSLLELHSGTIRAESAGPNLGATFTIELPATEPAHLGPHAEPPSTETGAQTKQRILLVEDHADTLRVLNRMLRQRGYEIITASNVAEAIDCVNRESFDLLVTDLGLPDGSGYDVIRHLRSCSTTPGIAMSGFGMEEDLRRSREAGFQEHLVKPISLPRLVAAIDRVGAGRGAGHGNGSGSNESSLTAP